jgi:hypothetical protein
VDELRRMKRTIDDDYESNHLVYDRLQRGLIKLEINDPTRPLIAKEFAAAAQKFFEIMEDKKCLEFIMSSHHIA